jgi:ABC-type branched-subunit amino acid transport system substrate-binding protein
VTVALVLAQASIETRSRGWVWIVAVGLALALVLAAVIARAVVSSLPDDVAGPVRKAVRSNVTPLGVGAVIVIGTIVFALWSAGLPVVETTGGADVAAGNTSVDSSGSGEETAGGTVTPDGSTSGGTTASGGRSTATTRRGAAGNTSPVGASLGAPQFAIKDANLYSGAANTRGISNDTIKVCGHAALSLGAVLNTKPEDLLVFWRWLNDKGGLYGRKFEVSLTDDQYTAEGGVPAAQECAEKNPFMIFGALGSDVIPPVRVWAEQNKELYLYGFTLRKGSENFKYSFSGGISQEDLSLVIADLAVKKFPGKKIGLVWRNSSNFQPGRDAFKNHVTKHGMKIVADLPVQKSQGSYTQEIITLQQAGAEAVFVLDDAVSQLNVVKQGKTQQYNPNWLLFTFNIQNQTLGNDALNPPLTGANLSPAYECHTFDGPYASYAEEIRTFEAAYAKYSPNTDLCGIAGDIAWGGWIGFKGMAALFEACGPNCTRNRYAGVMESGYKATIGAACEVDFSRTGHHGVWAADVMEAYAGPRGRPAFRNTQRCAKAPTT